MLLCLLFIHIKEQPPAVVYYTYIQIKADSGVELVQWAALPDAIRYLSVCLVPRCVHLTVKEEFDNGIER